MRLTTSDIIQIINVIFSLLLSSVAIVISIKTLKQNKEMLISSTRAYLSVYTAMTDIYNLNYFIILKNFGNSNAHIKSLKCNCDLSKISILPESKRIPFQHISETFIAPGQSFQYCIDHVKLQKLNKLLTFDITYVSNGITYDEHFVLNHIADKDFLKLRAKPDNGKELLVISQALQDISEKFL